MKQHVLGISALVIGVVALGLAVIPGIALERPLPFIDEQHEPEPPETAREEGLTLKINKFSVTIGSGEIDEEKNLQRQKQHRQAVAIHRKQMTDRDQQIKWFTICAAMCSLVGLTLGPISWAKESQPAVSGAPWGSVAPLSYGNISSLESLLGRPLSSCWF